MYSRLSFFVRGIRQTSAVMQRGLSDNTRRNFSVDKSHFTGAYGRTYSTGNPIRPAYEMNVDEYQYDSLSKEDKESVKSFLSTHGGVYALNKGYLTVKGYLGLSLKARLRLSDVFDDYIERPCDVDNVKTKLDRLFGNNKFNLNNSFSLPPDKRHYLMELLEGSFLTLTTPIEHGSFTLDEFLELDIEQQQALMKINHQFYSVEPSHPIEPGEIHQFARFFEVNAVCKKIREQFLIFQDINQAKTKFSSILPGS